MTGFAANGDTQLGAPLALHGHLAILSAGLKHKDLAADGCIALQNGLRPGATHLFIGIENG
jgi:hypothetical protein